MQSEYEFRKHRALLLNICYRCNEPSQRLHCNECLLKAKIKQQKRLKKPGTGRGSNNRGRAWGNGLLIKNE